MASPASNRPFVSFCFTTFKRGEVLRSTLLTVQRQTFSDFEVIVSDNDPAGSGRFYVESLNDPRFKYFPNNENLGMKPSFNKSLERSSGEFIVMIADDDPVYPEMLEVLVKLHKEYPGYGMYMGGCDWFCTDKQVAKMNNLRVGTNSCISSDYDLNYIKEFKTDEFITTLFTFGIFKHYLWSTAMVERQLLVSMGGVPDYGTPFLGDFAYMSIASAKKGCVVINRSLGCQTMHKENFGRNQDEQLPVLAKKFPTYLEDKLSGIDNWPKVKNVIRNFLGLWLVGHMAFLYKYKRINKIDYTSLTAAEQEVFSNEFMKKYKLKYVLKKRFPALHNTAVKLKKTFTGRRD